MKFTYKDKEYYIDKTLAYQLLSLVYNIKSDWDFVILITGDRKVRVGKSVLAITISAFLGYLFKTIMRDKKPLNSVAYGMDNIFFDNKVMMDEAQKRAKYSIIHYDEAREGLAANKAMKQFQQDLIDFFNECGQLNHIFIVVCPDFFELKEEIAVGRSEFLINVYRKELKVERRFNPDIHKAFNIEGKIPVTKLERGYFEFFSRNKKATLYDKFKTMRKKNYNLVKADFIGRFTDQYCEDEEQYKKLKADSLSRFKERHKAALKEPRGARDRDYYVKYRREIGKTYTEIAKEIEVIFNDSVTPQALRMAQTALEKRESDSKGGNAYTNNLSKEGKNLGEVG